MAQNQGLDRRYRLKEREVREILEKAEAALGKIDRTPFMKGMEAARLSPKERILLVGEVPVFIDSDAEVFPTLLNKEVISKLPTITVDMGAVPYLCNGADLMAPGIVKISGEFQAEEVAVVVDEKFSKPIALVKTLYDSKGFSDKKQGKVATNIHYVGDKFWKIIKGAKR